MRKAGFLLRELHAFGVAIVKDWHKAVSEWEYIAHHTKKRVLFKFCIVLIILGAYLWYVTSRFGNSEGLLVTALTWSFFVFCTPIADAGILLDFPMRAIANVRMVYTEIMVWMIAIVINLIAFLMAPTIYDNTIVLQLFAYLLTHPWPYWGVILLCGAGTFLSVIFGDELIDVAKEHHRKLHHKHSHKWELIVIATILILILIIYDFLLKALGIPIPLL